MEIADGFDLSGRQQNDQNSSPFAQQDFVYAKEAIIRFDGHAVQFCSVSIESAVQEQPSGSIQHSHRDIR
ncbi:uncharacterized protein RCO7_14239 [Rhynchosporium graminicola]|uniref:Uncharacterized protein n=2 Tax=Rhynchosporium TaxID=38037 RepID=A0A1E1LWK8_RHYSE|nr:uncharacterized protein RCO7_14239 [Rhynchosporium commune]CZT41246.1 uncharacterized protein RSE6_00967 [Rhynchosporium secalis]